MAICFAGLFTGHLARSFSLLVNLFLSLGQSLSFFWSISFSHKKEVGLPRSLTRTLQCCSLVAVYTRVLQSRCSPVAV